MLQLRTLLTTLVLLAMFVLFQHVASLSPAQPGLVKFCKMAAGLLVLSMFPQLLWWIWSLS